MSEITLKAQKALRTVMQTYQSYTDGVLKEAVKVTNKTAYEEAAAISAEAPKRSKSEHSYSMGEAVKKGTLKDGKLSSIEEIIYNKNKPQLGHLLEYGHKVVDRNGITVGNAKAYPHIKTNEEKFNEIYVQRIVEAIRNHGGRI